MPTLLEQAIIDAKTLREAALKNAEDAVINKYSDEVRKTLNTLLEQEEDMGLDLGGEDMGLEEPAADAGAGEVDDAFAGDIDEVPYAAEDDMGELDGNSMLRNSPTAGEPQTINLDLGALSEHARRLNESMETIEVEEEDVEELSDGLEDLADMVRRLLSGEEDEEEEDDEEYEFDEEEEEEDEEEDDMNEVRAIGPKGADYSGPYNDPTYGKDKKKKKDEEEKGGTFTLAGKKKLKEEEEEDEQSDLEDEALETAADTMEEDLAFDAFADAIIEKLTVDMGATLSGWAGRSAADKEHQMELELAHRRSTDIQQELETLKKAQEELVFENKKLTSELSKYRTAIGELKESVEDINLSNARLLYTNRVLRNTSLNERQKQTIVEAISKSDSVAEARTIYNTLQSTVQSTPQRGPKSLSEAISRPSSLIRATRKESSKPTDIFADRMKQLAGIK
jgi:hypothetical protein